MELKLYRVYHTDEATLGNLYVDGKFECFTLEDQPQDGPKVYGETRIPAGKYPIVLRTNGGMHARYERRYPWHRGMLWLQDVEDFQFIYLHPGNTDDHSLGCILTGNTARTDPLSMVDSLVAYTSLYYKVLRVIDHEAVTIEVIDEVDR